MSTPLVARTALVNRLRASTSTTVVTVVAPGGYGKTRLLEEWSRRDGRPFAWVPIGDPVSPGAADDDPRPLVPGIADTLAAAPAGIVIVLDDVHRLTGPRSLKALAALIGSIAPGAQIVLAGRGLPELPLARLRVARRLTEIGVDDLRLSDREARTLVRHARLGLPATEIDDLNRQAEGWPACLELTALAAAVERGSPPGRGVGVSGTPGLDVFFRRELVGPLSDEDARFLRCTSILERLSGPVCDAMLGLTGSAERLERLERSSLLLPLDRRRGGYRLHPLARRWLALELERSEPPELVATLHRRAGEWLAAHGEIPAAIDCLAAAGDIARLIALLGRFAAPLWQSGDAPAIEHWLACLDEPAILDHHPEVAVYGTLAYLALGRPEDADRLADAAEHSSYDGPMPDGSASPDPWRAVVRALLCRNGNKRMAKDAAQAIAALPSDSLLLPAAQLALGAARLLAGREAAADAAFAAAAESAESHRIASVASCALAERALISADRGSSEQSSELIAHAVMLLEEAGLAGYPQAAFVYAAAARASLRRGDWGAARTELEHASRVLPGLSYAEPWLAVQARLELMHAHIALAETAACVALAAEVDQILALRPGLGILVEQAAEVRRTLDRKELSRRAGAGAASLTPAELRLLPFLATHLSFREIADELIVSRNTVKTQAISVYRKLDVSSRGEAIRRAVETGLAVGPAAVVTARPSKSSSPA